MVKLSSAGQITLPAAVRKSPRARGARFFRLTELAPDQGTYLLEPIPGLGEVFARHAGQFGAGLVDDLASLRSEEDAREPRPDP